MCEMCTSRCQEHTGVYGLLPNTKRARKRANWRESADEYNVPCPAYGDSVLYGCKSADIVELQ